MGMITNVDLEEGLSFGPLPTALMIADPAYLIAHTTTDQLAELPTIHTDPKKLSEPIRLIEWICNIRCARFPEEQNVELIRSSKSGQSFYRVTRTIYANQELLVWFRRQDLEPLLLDIFKNHSMRAPWMGYNTDVSNEHLSGLNEKDRVKFEKEKSVSELFSCSRCSSQFTYIYPFIAHYLFKCPVMLPTQYHSSELFNLETTFKSPTIFSEIKENNFQNKLTSPVESTIPHSNSNISTILEFDPLKTNDDICRRSFQSNTSYSSPVCRSSHEKPYAKYNIPEDKSYIKTLNTIPSLWDFSQSSELNLGSKGPNSVTNSITTNLQNKHTIRPSTSQSINIIHSKSIKKINSHLHARKSRSKSGLISLKTRNPLIEQLLQTLIKKPENYTIVDSTTSSKAIPGLANLVMAQNWCARCSVTFRLTSDLVHHMRTHHNQDNGTHNKSSRIKTTTPIAATISSSSFTAVSDGFRDGDEDNDQEDYEVDSCHESETNLFPKSPTHLSHGSLRSKNSQKSGGSSTHITNRLNCDLCGEVFREKHHLTRHMLSHS